MGVHGNNWPGSSLGKLLAMVLLLGCATMPSAADPYRYSWALDGGLVAGGLALELYGSQAVRRMDPYRAGEFTREELLPWDRPFAGTWSSRADVFSDGLLLVGGIPLAWGVWQWRGGRSTGTEVLGHTLMLTEVLLLQSGINMTVRSLRLWPRPFVLGTQGGKERHQGQAAGSFYSGHASAAFAVAAFSASVYQDLRPGSPGIPWVWGAGFAVAGSVAVLRVAAGKHYPTDVLVGALIGTGIGWGIPKLHRGSSSFALTPIPGGVRSVWIF